MAAAPKTRPATTTAAGPALIAPKTRPTAALEVAATAEVLTLLASDPVREVPRAEVAEERDERIDEVTELWDATMEEVTDATELVASLEVDERTDEALEPEAVVLVAAPLWVLTEKVVVATD